MVVDTGNSMLSAAKPNAPPAAPDAPAASLCHQFDDGDEAALPSLIVHSATLSAVSMALRVASLTTVLHCFGNSAKPFSMGVPTKLEIFAAKPGLSSNNFADFSASMSASVIAAPDFFLAIVFASCCIVSR